MISTRIKNIYLNQLIQVTPPLYTDSKKPAAAIANTLIKGKSDINIFPYLGGVFFLRIINGRTLNLDAPNLQDKNIFMSEIQAFSNALKQNHLWSIFFTNQIENSNEKKMKNQEHVKPLSNTSQILYKISSDSKNRQRYQKLIFEQLEYEKKTIDDADITDDLICFS